MSQTSGEVHPTGSPVTAIWTGRFTGRVIPLTGAGGLGSAARGRLEAEGAAVVAADAIPVDAADPGRRPQKNPPTRRQVVGPKDESRERSQSTP